MAKAKTTVEYRDIPGFPGYRVGNDGSVLSCWRKVGLGYGGGTRYVMAAEWRPRRPAIRKDRRVMVTLTRNGSIISKWVHRLVLEAFIGPCPKGMQCCHWDGNPSNNNLGNLRWDSGKANMSDMIRHGRTTRGERDAMAKLTVAEVTEIRRRYASGELQREIAAAMRVTRGQISRIVTGANWGHVA